MSENTGEIIVDGQTITEIYFEEHATRDELEQIRRCERQRLEQIRQREQRRCKEQEKLLRRNNFFTALTALLLSIIALIITRIK